MQSKATTVSQYLNELPADRKSAIRQVREVILQNIDPDFQECMQYGMIGYAVPHSIYPSGYHCDPKQPLMYAALASQKNYMSLYVCSAYGDQSIDAWIREQFALAGKKLDMGKCCIRFKRIEDLPLQVIASLFQRIRLVDYVQGYERALAEIRDAKLHKAAGSKRSASPKSSSLDSKSSSKKRVANKANAATKPKANKGNQKSASSKAVCSKAGTKKRKSSDKISLRQSKVTAKPANTSKKSVTKTGRKSKPSSAVKSKSNKR